MATLRIKDIVTTASTPSSDDVLAIDGVTSGTRKMSVYNIPVNTAILSALTANSLVYVNGSKATTSVVLSSNLSLSTGTLDLSSSISLSGTVTASRLISNVATGTAPFTVASTTVVSNLNASLLNGTTFAAPGAIGGTTPSTGAFTALTLPAGDVQTQLNTISNSRGPAQGLVFDGSAGATVANVQAFGTGDFTVALWIVQDAAKECYLTYGTNDRASFIVRANGSVDWYSVGSIIASAPAGTVEYGKAALITVSRTGGTTTISKNAASIATGADATTIANTISHIGANNTGGYAFNGFIRAQIFNTALTATEVRALYEIGTLPAWCYPANPAGTNITVGSFVNYQYDTFTGASAAGFTAVETGGQTSFAYRDLTGYKCKVGDKFLVSFSGALTSGATPTVKLYNDSGSSVSSPVVVSAGQNKIVLIALVGVSGADNLRLVFDSVGNTSYAISGLTLIPLGAVCAPDANQPGNGPQWRDASGNNAHTNLPGDGISGGVTWSCPGGSSGDFGETRTASGYALGRDAVVLPPGYRIARIWVSGNGTFSIGNAASGTEVVNGFTATADSQPATLAAYTTASRKLYITLGSATTLTYAVHLERI